MNIKAELRNKALAAIEGGQHIVKTCCDNPRKFKDNLIEIGTPSWVVSGAYVALPIVFPVLATPKYFAQVRASIVLGTAFAVGTAALVTSIEEEATTD